MDKQISISSEYVRGYLRGAVRLGHDPYVILDDAGIPHEAYDLPSATITGRQLQELIYVIARAVNDNYLGLLEHPQKPAMGHEVLKAGTRQDTLGEALRTIAGLVESCRYDLVQEYELDESGKALTVRLRNYGVIDGMDSHLVYLYRLKNAHDTYSLLVGRLLKLCGVSFSQKKPEWGFDYRQLFNCDVRFEQPHDEMVFPARYLRQKVVADDVADVAAIRWFSDAVDRRTMTSRVEGALTRLQEQGVFSPSADVVAGLLATTPRTMRRLLAAENESFQKIRSRLRGDLAAELLVTTDLPIARIAERVGFSEPGDFTRAFVRLTGSTPRAHRRRKRMSMTGAKAGQPSEVAGSSPTRI